MAADLGTDVRRWRRALTLACVALAAVVAAALAQAARPEWRRVQAASGQPSGIAQFTTCEDEVDRCLTCHARQGGAAGHPLSLARHPPEAMGCATCHGGTARALTSRAAHAAPGTDRPDPKLKGAHLEASCAKCHVPGDAPGMEHLVRGAAIFAELGCAVCHPLSGGGRGGWDYGPDLRAIGRKSPEYLQEALFEPTRRFPGSSMPSFEHAFASDKGALLDLEVFVESLALPRAPQPCSARGRSAALAALRCAACHAGAGGRASGQLSHRCLYIRERKGALLCATCHAQGVPAAGPFGGSCPFVEEQRGACAACHDEAAARR